MKIVKVISDGGRACAVNLLNVTYVLAHEDDKTTICFTTEGDYLTVKGTFDDVLKQLNGETK